MGGGPARRTRLSATVIAALVAVACELALVLRARHVVPDFPAIRVYGAALTGTMFVACGLVAVWRTRYPRMGWVLVAAGFLWMLEDLQTTKIDTLDRIGIYTAHGSDLALALVVMSFPTGRILGRGARFVVGMTVLEALVLAPARWITNNSCDPCGWWYHVSVAHWVDHAVDVAQNVVSVVALCAGVLVMAHRWRTGTKPARRTLAPFLGTAIVLGLLALPSVAGGPRTLGDLLPLSRAAFPIAFLAGLQRVRMTRLDLTAMVAELDREPSLRRLRDTLARTVGDPLIAIRPVIGDTWSDEDGTPTATPVADARHAVTPINGPAGPLGALVHDPALADDPQLLDAVVGAIGMALRNEALHAEVTHQLARATDATDSERRRVARDLHDGAQQRLVALRLDVAALRRRLADTSDADIQTLLTDIDDGARESLTELRRLVHGLAPPTLAEDGLGPAIRELALSSRVPVTVEDHLTNRPPPAIESAAYLITSEALTNIAKHAGATVARVQLTDDDDTLHLTISDDGHGGADPTTGTGLHGLTDRARALGGNLHITSPPSRGTTITVDLPTTTNAGLARTR